ncbi:unnamed protein product [Porites evermanni]|uniref:Transcription initiation factor IIF subunit alpha n=1 Tax=Porites evermanni TaxID=104178 RepID=A0ABN8LRK7_9CNID|nr:unnamed protein product [Porites evermanni]
MKRTSALFLQAKAKKRPAGAVKGGLFSEEEIPERKRPRVSPAPFSVWLCFMALWYVFFLLLTAIRNLEIPRRGKRREKPPACLLDPELGEHHFLRTASNIRIQYVAKGDTGKPFMLCLHGFPEFWYSWRYQLKAFSDNFRMVAVDLRGYGDSDSPKGREHYKTSLLVNDIKEIIEALDYKSCTLLSHDWGGALAWGSLHAPAPLTCDKRLRTFTWEARNSYFSEGMVFTGKQELSISSSHIILDFKSIRELGMVQSSINRGVIKQKIGLRGEGKQPVDNGNNTEWSPIRSVIKRVINKILCPRSRSPICLITSRVKTRRSHSAGKCHDFVFCSYMILNVFCVCKGDKKKKKKSGSGSSTSSNSCSSTPTIATDGAANTIAAAATKLNQDRPGTPSKSKKRPASASKKGTPGEEGSPANKKPRVSPAPSTGGAGGGSRTSTPTSTGSEEGPQGITEEAVRRYLTRKPMTSKDLLQKFKSKRTGLSNNETVKKLAAIVRKIQPEQKTIKGKLYLSLKPQS